jgi:hypothetical protein
VTKPAKQTRSDFSRLQHQIAFALVVGASVAVGRDLRGQTLRVPQGATQAQIVAAAEADGAAYPRFAGTPTRDASPRSCVDGREVGPALSGEFTIGGNLSGSVAMRAGRQGKVWWAPLRQAADMPPLLVRGRSLTTPSDTVWYASSSVAYSGGTTLGPLVDRKYFFPSGIAIPRPGRWLLIATSGPNWGCFILTVV